MSDLPKVPEVGEKVLVWWNARHGSGTYFETGKVTKITPKGRVNVEAGIWPGNGEPKKFQFRPLPNGDYEMYEPGAGHFGTHYHLERGEAAESKLAELSAAKERREMRIALKEKTEYFSRLVMSGKTGAIPETLAEINELAKKLGYVKD